MWLLPLSKRNGVCYKVQPVRIEHVNLQGRTSTNECCQHLHLAQDSTDHVALPTVHQALGLLNSTVWHWVRTAWVTGERTPTWPRSHGRNVDGRIRTPEDLVVAVDPTQWLTVLKWSRCAPDPCLSSVFSPSYLGRFLGHHNCGTSDVWSPFIHHNWEWEVISSGC